MAIWHDPAGPVAPSTVIAVTESIFGRDHRPGSPGMNYEPCGQPTPNRPTEEKKEVA
jgi:hypothetical protein